MKYQCLFGTTVIIFLCVFFNCGLQAQNVLGIRATKSNFQKPQSPFKASELNSINVDEEDGNMKILETLEKEGQEFKKNLEFLQKLKGNIKIDEINKLETLLENVSDLKKDYKKLNAPNALNLNDASKLIISVQKVKEKYKEIQASFVDSTKDKTFLAGTTPSIDGFDSRIAPSAKIKGTFRTKGIFDFQGEIFTGNALNSEPNTSALYNPASSDFGTNLFSSITFDNEDFFVSGTFCTSFARKSIFRIDSTALNFYQMHTTIGIELGFKNTFSINMGYNMLNPLDNHPKLRKELNFSKNTEDLNEIISTYQGFFNIGFRGIYSLTDDPGVNLALDVNGILLGEEQEEILDKKDDLFLIILRLSLTKNF